MCIGGNHLHRNFKPMNNTELTLDQLQTIAGGGVFAKLDGNKGGVECKVPPSVKDVILGPLGGEGVFLDRSEVKAFSAAARWRLKEVILWEIITSELCKKNVKKDFACDGEVFFFGD